MKARQHYSNMKDYSPTDTQICHHISHQLTLISVTVDVADGRHSQAKVCIVAGDTSTLSILHPSTVYHLWLCY